MLYSLCVPDFRVSASLGEIVHLRDHEMFGNIILAELQAQTRYDPKNSDPFKNPSYIARMIGTRYTPPLVFAQPGPDQRSPGSTTNT